VIKDRISDFPKSKAIAPSETLYANDTFFSLFTSDNTELLFFIFNLKHVGGLSSVYFLW
jgi:hypothetical protein